LAEKAEAMKEIEQLNQMYQLEKDEFVKVGDVF